MMKQAIYDCTIILILFKYVATYRAHDTSTTPDIQSTMMGDVVDYDTDSEKENELTSAPICTAYQSNCTKTRYRSYDGSCNNLANPTWGTPNNAYENMVQSNYADGVNSWPTASDGGSLPNTREISIKIFIPKLEIEHKWNLNTQQWGQIVAHDLSLTAGPDKAKLERPVCCDDNGNIAPDAGTHPLCRHIPIPPDDDFHVPEGKQCMNFIRTTSTKDINCTGPNDLASPLSVVTSYMDLSLTYGNDERHAKAIREGSGGRMWTTVRNGYEWPPQTGNIKKDCIGVHSTDEPCYLLGDTRGNQSPQLTALHIILVNEHNRIADALSTLNPHWDDEKIYQEARRIAIAETQHINYYEYLIILLGKNNMINKKLIYPQHKDYVNDYNPNVSAAIYKEYASAAFRHFHTMIRGYLNLITEDRILARSVRLSDWFNRPALLEKGDGFDDLVRGLSYQAADKSDEYWDFEVTRFLFKGNHSSGGDLRAMDIQRGRDHGLGTYVQLRAHCDLSVPDTFKDLKEYMSKENVQKLKELYESIEDIDLVVGGSLEKHAPGALVGPTFLCILLQQFLNVRIGDRYFYENGKDQDIAFTLPQLNSIRNGASMARLLCDNGHKITWMQRRAFELVSDENPLVRCDELPAVNLTLWQESVPEEKVVETQ
ncbi:PREDICTED: peroxidase-like isoform X2 [Papilio xuthus]|nr:PREDICTED: peroxidase-like isoform X2 [Papilio xuthus]XP_013174137.1 PREDICTED: peroxidase-like isoform X2 [Papilio xuthus]XP_013174138.1 PREDICTED: peroxidase-like isoform X2 [Papilio xuthus]XP_013174139.1 PREDICTED: peroxidase-like isoform X2 [Papilio xuthus]